MRADPFQHRLFVWPLFSLASPEWFRSTDALRSFPDLKSYGLIKVWFQSLYKPGIEYDEQVVALPLALVWHRLSGLEGVTAMKVAKFISYGDHLETPRAPALIRITRIPGVDPAKIYGQGARAAQTPD